MKNNRIWIALCGRMQVGKSTSADHLIGEHEFHKVSLATPLKEAARIFKWDGEKDAKGRRLLQHLGDVAREYNPNVFMDIMLERVDHLPRVICDDMRLVAEADFLRNAGFTIVRIERPTHGEDPTGSGHRTEMEVDAIEPDFVIMNDGTVEDLYLKIDALFERELSPPAPASRPTSPAHVPAMDASEMAGVFE